MGKQGTPGEDGFDVQLQPEGDLPCVICPAGPPGQRSDQFVVRIRSTWIRSDELTDKINFFRFRGPQGERGRVGEPGSYGGQGPSGKEGAEGPAGPRGAPGLAGPKGMPGRPGIQGDQVVAGKKNIRVMRGQI